MRLKIASNEEDRKGTPLNTQMYMHFQKDKKRSNVTFDLASWRRLSHRRGGLTSVPTHYRSCKKRRRWDRKGTEYKGLHILPLKLKDEAIS